MTDKRARRPATYDGSDTPTCRSGVRRPRRRVITVSPGRGWRGAPKLRYRSRAPRPRLFILHPSSFIPHPSACAFILPISRRSPVTLLAWKRSAYRERPDHVDMHESDQRTFDLPVFAIRGVPLVPAQRDPPVLAAGAPFRCPTVDRGTRGGGWNSANFFLTKRTQESALALSKTPILAQKRTQTNPKRTQKQAQTHPNEPKRTHSGAARYNPSAPHLGKRRGTRGVPGPCGGRK